MPICKAFFQTAKKYLPNMFTYFIVFLVLIIVFTATAGNSYETQFSTQSVDLALIDRDGSTASAALCRYITETQNIIALSDDKTETLLDALYYHKISYVLVISEGFEKQLLNGETDGLVKTAKRADSAAGFFADQTIDSYLTALSMYLSAGFTLSDAIAQTDKSFSGTADVNAVFFAAQAETSSGMYYYFQYFTYVVLMIVFMGLSPVLMTFRKKTIGARILCSALPQKALGTQLALGCIGFVSLIWFVFMGIALVLYKPTLLFSANGLLCLLNSLAFLLVAVALALFFGLFQLNGNVLNMISNLIGLGMSFLCGVFVPQQYLGTQVLSVARFLPAYWNIRIVNMLAPFSDDVFSYEAYWTCIGIQLLFFFAIFAVYLCAARQRRRL